MKIIWRVFILIALLIIPISSSYSSPVGAFMTLGYGGEGSNGKICPRAYANGDSGSYTKSVYIASAQAGAWWRVYADVYLSVGYNGLACVYGKGEILESPYVELRLGTIKYFTFAAHKQDTNPFGPEDHFYEMRLGRMITDGFSADISAMTGPVAEGEERIINYYLMGRLHF